MTRLKQAWLALTKGLDIICVPGKAMVREVYRTEWKEYRLGPHGVGSRDRVAYFESCADAHATGRRVTAVKVLRTNDGDFLPPNELRRVTVEPKPKIAKGKRK
jgi:hypothetical protein